MKNKLGLLWILAAYGVALGYKMHHSFFVSHASHGGGHHNHQQAPCPHTKEAQEMEAILASILPRTLHLSTLSIPLVKPPILVRDLFFIERSTGVIYASPSFSQRQVQGWMNPLKSSIASSELTSANHPLRKKDPLQIREYTVSVTTQNLSKELRKAGIQAKEIKALIHILKSTNVQLQPKDQLYLSIQAVPNQGTLVKNLQCSDGHHSVSIARTKNTFNLFKATTQVVKPIIETVPISGTIRTNLYTDGAKAGIDREALDAMVKAFSSEVDLKRRMGPGDKFKLCYSRIKDPSGKRPARLAQMVFANVLIKGIEKSIFWYRPPGHNQVRLYNAKGQWLGSRGLRQAVAGARLSAPFGVRKHPILGFTRMHNGIDLRAPKGTTVVAVEDGVIESVQRHPSYGNMVIINHGNRYKSLYAHLSRVAALLGEPIKKGDRVGYVGSTGLATGAHLHLELHYNGKPVDPQTVKTFSVNHLTGKPLQSFVAHCKMLNASFVESAPFSKIKQAPKQVLLTPCKGNKPSTVFAGKGRNVKHTKKQRKGTLL